jgi:hypothetical protein
MQIMIVGIIFALFNIKTYIKLNNLIGKWDSGSRQYFKVFVIGLLLVISGDLSAQWDMGGSVDTTKIDSSALKKIPYVRFVPPYDTMREIIFYEGVVENEDCQLCTADSLYWRAKKVLLKKYGKSVLRKMILDEKVGHHITVKVTLPMVVINGKYSKAAKGMMEYKLCLRFQDSRFKYQFGNFIHLQTGEGLVGNPTKTYHEYYMRVKRGYEATDKFLLASDREVKDMVSKITYALREPYRPEEDEW